MVPHVICFIPATFQFSPVPLPQCHSVMRQDSIGLQPSLLLPPNEVPSTIAKQKRMVLDMLDETTLKLAGWDNGDALVADLMAPRYRHFGEVFCGWGVVFAQCISLGLLGFYYDMEIGGKYHNILRGPGLLFLIQNILTIMSGGFVWFGTPCSTWVWIARGHTQRSSRNIEGNTCRLDVRQANRMVDIVAMLLNLIVVRGVFYLIEQPSTSCIWRQKKLLKHFRSRPMVHNTPLKKHHVWLGYFGHHLFESTTLVGIIPALKSI